MENFHSDILENILSRLPTKEALHAKRVCTTWRAILRKKTERSGFLFCLSHVDNLWIGGQKVRKQLFYGDEYDHYDHPKLNYYYSDKTLSKIQHGKCIMQASPRDIMVGSCNGLVLIGKCDRDAALGLLPALICNPLTGESVFLPDYNYSGYPKGHVSSGFGYCASTNKYKVVTVHCNQNNHKGHFQVYTIGGKWRYIGSIRRYNRACNTFDCSTGIYANGALHWLHQSDPQGQEREIVALDLESERFRYITLPLSDQQPPELLGGNNNLYLCYKITDYVSYRTDIWVYNRNNIFSGTYCACHLKQNYHRWSPWIKEFSIQSRVSCRYFVPFGITRNNEVLLWFNHDFGLMLYSYDPKTSIVKKLWDYNTVKDMNCIYIQSIPCIQSVVSLKDLGETNVTFLKDLKELMLQVN